MSNAISACAAAAVCYGPRARTRLATLCDFIGADPAGKPEVQVGHQPHHRCHGHRSSHIVRLRTLYIGINIEL
eukprot:SAG11_NODE_30088_length_304_cov_0.795122_1_plen_72_part_10